MQRDPIPDDSQACLNGTTRTTRQTIIELSGILPTKTVNHQAFLLPTLLWISVYLHIMFKIIV